MPHTCAFLSRTCFCTTRVHSSEHVSRTCTICCRRSGARQIYAYQLYVRCGLVLQRLRRPVTESPKDSQGATARSCQESHAHQGAVLLTVGRSYVGNYVARSTLLDRACACSYKNLPKYRSYRISNTAPWPLSADSFHV